MKRNGRELLVWLQAPDALRNMRNETRAVVAGACLVLLALAVVLHSLRGPRGQQPLDGREPEPARHRAVLDSPLDANGSDSPLGSPSASSELADGRRGVAPDADDELSGDPGITGRILDAVTGLPISGASIDAVYRLHQEFTNLDLVHNKRSRVVGEATSDVSGEFRLVVPEDLPLELTARSAGYATARRDHVFSGDHLVIELSGAAVFEGQVTRASDGSPRSGVELRGWDDAHVERFRGVTNAGGFYRFDDVEAGVLTVEITPVTLSAPAWQTIELVAGKRLQRDFALSDGVTIRGTVTDALTGEPIAGAEIGHGWTFERPTRSDARGAYELPGFGGPGVYDVHVRAAGYGEEQFEFDDAMPTEDTKLDFDLSAARSAFGRVVDRDGNPLEGVYAAGVASEFLNGEQYTDWESTHTDPQGAFRFTSLDIRLSHQLLLRKEGYGTKVFDFPVDESSQTSVDLGTLELGPSGTIRGTLVSDSGAALPSFAIRLSGTNADVKKLRPGVEATNTTHYTRERESRTDGAGRFHFADIAPGSYEVVARVPGKRESEVTHGFSIEEGERIVGVQLILPLGRSVRGRVLSPEGDPLPEVSIDVFSADAARLRLGRSTSGAAGAFEVLGLADDDVVLVANPDFYNWSTEGEKLGRSESTGATPGDEGIVLRLRERTTLTGRVVDAQEVPVSDMSVACYESGTRLWIAGDTTDDEGHFTFELPQGASVDLETGLWIRKGEDESIETGREHAVRAEGVPSNASDVLLRVD